MRERCDKPVEASPGKYLGCFLDEGHTTPEECYSLTLGPVTAHQENCESPGKDCQGCWDGETPPEGKQ